MIPISHLVRRRAGFLLLSLFLLGGVGAPVLDGWLHGRGESSSLQNNPRHECTVCRLVSTPATPGSDAPRLSVPSRPVAELRIAAGETAPRSGSHRLLPPSRAPPSA